MSKSPYENIFEKQNRNEPQRLQPGQRILKSSYVPRGPADATPPPPLCKSRLQLFDPERQSRQSPSLNASGGNRDKNYTEQAVVRNNSPAVTPSAPKSSRLRPANIVKPYRAISPSLQTTGQQAHNRSPPASRPRTIMPAHGTPLRLQQAASQPSSPMRNATRSYNQNLFNFFPGRENYPGSNLSRPSVDQSHYTKRIASRPPLGTRSVSSGSDSSSRFPPEEFSSSQKETSALTSSACFKRPEPSEVSTEALRCLESRLRQLVMSKEAQASQRDSSSDYDSASALLTPSEVQTRPSTSDLNALSTSQQKQTFSSRLPVLKLLKSSQCESNFDEGPISESSSSASLQDFTHEELRYLLQAVHNMLAMQTSPNLDSQPQRPFSWYVAANRSPSEDAYQLGSAGTASPKTVQPPANTPKSLSDLDFDVLPLIDADDLDLPPRSPRNRQSTASTLLPPVLPAGFRNFSRYLDTKFGPDSSSVSLESIADPQGANEAGSGGPSNAAPTAEANVMAENTTVAKKEGHGRQQIKASCSPVATIADIASPNYYSDNIAKSWTNRSPLPVRTHAPRERRASAHGEADFLVQNRRQTAVTSPLANESRIRTGSASPTSSYFSDWPQNENAPTSTPTYDFNVSCLPLPSHGLAWSDYRSRTYWSTPQFLPYAWNTVHTPPPPPPPPPLPPPTIPFFPSWFPFADYFSWCGPAGPYGPHPHAIPPYAQIPPLVPVLPHQRPTFNPAADWFRAAANHFAAAAMFADRQGQTDETVQSTAAASAAAFDNRRLAQTRRSADPAPRKSETSRIPAKIAPSASSVSMRSKPQVAINGTLVSPEEPSPPGPPRRRMTEPSQDAPNTSRPAESPLSEATGSSDDNPWTDDFRERFFEDLELPQDPALILPDYLDFYARIKGLLELDCSIVLPLPPGWSMGVSSSGRRFYICDRTRNTTWQHPVVASRVPLGWERVEMGQGCVYYRHLLIPHAQRHHPDLWFPANLKNLDSERQGWFFELRKLQDSLSNFDKGISALIEAYADTMDAAEEAEFIPGFRQKNASDLNSLVQQLECRFFRDLHRIIVAYELARIRIVRQLLVRHNARPCSSAPCSPSPSSTKTV